MCFSLTSMPAIFTMASCLWIGGGGLREPEIRSWWHHLLPPSDLLAKYWLSFPMTLCSPGKKMLVANGGILPQGDITMIKSNWKSRWLPGHLNSSCLNLNQQAKKGVSFLAVVILSDKQGRIGLLFYSGHKEQYVCSTDRLGYIAEYYCTLWLRSIEWKLQKAQSKLKQ